MNTAVANSSSHKKWWKIFQFILSEAMFMFSFALFTPKGSFKLEKPVCSSFSSLFPNLTVDRKEEENPYILWMHF